MKTNFNTNKSSPAALFKEELAALKRRAIVAQHKRVLHAAFVRLPEVKRLFVALTKAAQGYDAPWINVSDYNAEVSLGLSLRDLASFKDASLLRLLAQFAGDEWTSSTTDHTYDAPNRDYRFRQTISDPLGDPRLPAVRLTAAERRSLDWLREHNRYEVPKTLIIGVHIYAYVKADSDACRIEVVGIEEEVIKKEVKRIVCA
jgi:hypothetical protein